METAPVRSFSLVAADRYARQIATFAVTQQASYRHFILTQTTFIHFVNMKISVSL